MRPAPQNLKDKMKHETIYYAVYYKGIIASIHYTRSGVMHQSKAIFHNREEAEQYIEYINERGGYRIAEVKVKEVA